MGVCLHPTSYLASGRCAAVGPRIVGLFSKMSYTPGTVASRELRTRGTFYIGIYSSGGLGVTLVSRETP